MNFTTVTSIVGLLLAAFAASAAVIAMDESRRGELVRFWKRWLVNAFVIFAMVNSAIGIYLFVVGPPEIQRRDIVGLLTHLFNLIVIPGGLLVAKLLRLLELSDERRADLTAAVEALDARITKASPKPRRTTG